MKINTYAKYVETKQTSKHLPLHTSLGPASGGSSFSFPCRIETRENGDAKGVDCRHRCGLLLLLAASRCLAFAVAAIPLPRTITAQSKKSSAEVE